MKNITILVPHHAILGTIEGPRFLLTEVNSYLRSMGREPAFHVELAGLSKQMSAFNGLYTVATHKTIHDIHQTDLIIVPALEGDMEQTLAVNKDFIPWMVQRYKAGAEIASLCVGAFLLAAAGLLKGKQCATHWAMANEFRRLFPDVHLVEHKIITDERGIYTSGGAFSFLNLLLYLIEKYVGRDVAVLSSKAFLIDIERRSQSPFIIFSGQKAHDDEQVKQVQEYIEQNLQEKLTVNQLAVQFSLGRRNLERRFKKATSNTVTEYMQRVKIEAAKKSFESSRENINEVMYSVGYSDTKAFRTVFRKFTGLSPLEYRNKFNKEALAV
jgi:Transcriptional regulator containing an amidase domain and an AraC-type DNA-binding HTH domain